MLTNSKIAYGVMSISTSRSCFRITVGFVRLLLVEILESLSIDGPTYRPSSMGRRKESRRLEWRSKKIKQDPSEGKYSWYPTRRTRIQGISGKLLYES